MKSLRGSTLLIVLWIFALWTGSTGIVHADPSGADATYVRENYTKFEHMIPMRDGVRLFAAVYRPNRRSQTYPILLYRTPYGCRPYGADRYRTTLGPSARFARDGYIFVYQDVRGKFMSEGNFVNMTPHIPRKRGSRDVDESSDTYDTVEWLLKNVEDHNGRVGQWGISYPGFYAAAGMIDTHPALKAVSPQAPIADWFWDDFHHNGAFFLPHAFNFFARFGIPRPEPSAGSGPPFDHKTPDGYHFFLRMGPLKNADRVHFKEDVAFWKQIVEHPNYDSFWQARNILPHLGNVKCAVMTVGGWFDAEDLYGPLKIYRTIEKRNPGIVNILVMGPWGHGDWGRTDGEALGEIAFGFKTSEFYRKEIESRFFRRHLKGEGNPDLPEAFVFETGANRWRRFDTWPPRDLTERRLYLREGGLLAFHSPEESAEVFDEYVSDPAKPVPFTEDIDTGMTREYMTDDQRFAARRPDVLAYQTEILDEDLTLAGSIQAELWVSTSGTASDWIVKVIDVFPHSVPDSQADPRRIRMGGYQMMVRSEVMRGRFRNSFEHPEPFEPNKVTRVGLELQDLFHTFQRGHRIMIQIQSTWFPLVDRNPQRYVPNIFKADPKDFTKATQRVYRSREHPTHLKVGVLSPQR